MLIYVMMFIMDPIVQMPLRTVIEFFGAGTINAVENLVAASDAVSVRGPFSDSIKFS